MTVMQLIKRCCELVKEAIVIAVVADVHGIEEGYIYAIDRVPIDVFFFDKAIFLIYYFPHGSEVTSRCIILYGIEAMGACNE